MSAYALVRLASTSDIYAVEYNLSGNHEFEAVLGPLEPEEMGLPASEFNWNESESRDVEWFNSIGTDTNNDTLIHVCDI